MPTLHFWTTVALTVSIALASPRPQSSMGGGPPPPTGGTPMTPPGGTPPPGVTPPGTSPTGPPVTPTTPRVGGANTTRAPATTTTPATTAIYVGIPWSYCCPSLALFFAPAVPTGTGTSTSVVLQYPIVFPFIQSFGWWCCG